MNQVCSGMKGCSFKQVLRLLGEGICGADSCSGCVCVSVCGCLSLSVVITVGCEGEGNFQLLSCLGQADNK